MEILFSKCCFLHRAFNGYAGVVFIHGDLLGGHWQNISSGCMSEIVRCWQLILVSDIGVCTPVCR